MTTAADTYPHYTAAYEAQSPDVAPTLSALRSRGWDAFSRLGLPTARRGNEAWKYTNVAPIARETFAHPRPLPVGGAVVNAAFRSASVPTHPGWRTLVFVDGVFVSDLSGSGSASDVSGDLLVSPLSGGSFRHADLLGELARAEDDGFVALNTAFLRDGVTINVAAGTDAGVVNLVYLTTGRDQPRVTHPRTLISAQRDGRVKVIETYAGPDDKRYFTNAVTEIHVHEGAAVEHYRLLTDGMDAYHVGTSRVMQHRDSRFSSVSISRGAILGRNDFGVTLAGTGAECTLNGLYLTTGAQHMDNFINIDHTEPHGTSRLLYKGILDGQSRAVFGGNVTVRKDAQKTDAQQTDKNLLLSEQAEVDSKPSLLIYADDVKCGHGATAGHIDMDTVFYMRSRGLDLHTASRILIHAFASEIIDTVALEPLRDYLDDQFRNSIPDADISLPIGGR